MVVSIEKIKECWLALTTWVRNTFKAKYPLWLFIVVCLAAALFFWFVSCTARRASIETAIVGTTNYRGHDYIVFRVQDKDGTFSVVHDPDCPCKFVEPLATDLKWDLVL